MVNFELWIQIAVCAVSVIFLYGAFAARLRRMEKKADRHHQMMERLYRAEMKIRRMEEKQRRARYEETDTDLSDTVLRTSRKVF